MERVWKCGTEKRLFEVDPVIVLVHILLRFMYDSVKVKMILNRQ